MVKKFWKYIVAVLLIASLGLQLYMARVDSQTTDEAVHLFAGYTYLTRHDFRYNPEHPPLVKMIAALPVVLYQPNVPDDFAQWQRSGNFLYDSWKENRLMGEKLLYQSGNNPDTILFLGRLGPCLLTALLGLLIAVMAYKFFGYKASLLATTIFVLDPNIIAHGHLITTDIGASLTILFAFYRFYSYLTNRSLKNICFLGLALGLAMLCKFTTIILIPILLVISIYYIWKKGELHLKAVWQVLLAIIIAFAVVCIGYFGKLTPSPVATSVTTDIAIANNQPININPVVDKLYSHIRYVCLPRDFYKGLSMVLGHVEAGHEAFLLGKTSIKGWWYYFPVIFLAKSTLTTLALLTLLLVYVFRGKKDEKVIILLLAAATYFLCAMQSKANLGLRHILPIYPLLFIAFSYLAVIVKNKNVKAAIYGILLFNLLNIILTFPYFISYYNPIAGGVNNGHNIAGDSNYDWGQDTFRIVEYLENHNLGQKVYVEYNWQGQSALNYYGVKRLPFDSATVAKEDGFLIIGASAIHSKEYAFLDGAAPYDRITPSVFVYHLPQ